MERGRAEVGGLPEEDTAGQFSLTIKQLEQKTLIFGMDLDLPKSF